MNQQIKAMLLERSDNYQKEFENFPEKQDPSAVFEHECVYYLEPLSKFIVPLLARTLIEDKNDTLENYLPFIIHRYHDSVKKDIDAYKNGEDAFSKKNSKQILTSYNTQVLAYNNGTSSQKDAFVIDFIKFHYQTLEQIAERNPAIALETIAKLRTPKLQYYFLQQETVIEPIKELMQNDWLKSDWSKWLDKYFCYPRTKDFDEYFNKWIGREHLHVKMCKPLFDTYYDQVKIWLKNMEKKKEQMLK